MMICRRCGSPNVHVQRVAVTTNRKRGCAYWLLFGWLIDILLWIFLTLPRLLIALFFPRRIQTKIHSEAVCQNCGYAWRV